MPEARFGVIGGSGLYEMAGLERVREVTLKTPFGSPSDAVVLGEIGGMPVAFLPRHGRGHRILPGEINFRANLWTLKRLGVEFLLSVSAVGSLRENVHPGDIVVPDQFIDRTRGRRSTFFGDGIVAHVMFADPVCAVLSRVLAVVAHEDGAIVHDRGTYLCMEGPQFSTRAESLLYRQWNADVIGMTNLQEAKLAREAEMCFATLALVTDYDCWNSEGGEVEINEILRILRENAARARRIVMAVAARLPAERACPCPSALEHAIITDRSQIPVRTRRALAPIIGKYLERR
ncbi:MAG: S-methyl-5'-thioadenosine phosphorylase [Candidatus Binatia bacterium]